MLFDNVEACVQEWTDLNDDHKQLEDKHKKYKAKLEELSALQAQCIEHLGRERHRLGIIEKSYDKLRPAQVKHNEELEVFENDLTTRNSQLSEMEESCRESFGRISPNKSGAYWKLTLGSLQVSYLSKQDLFKYKDEYEKFKLALSMIALLLSVTNLVLNLRILDYLFVFLMVWYYSYLSIRESVLQANGSRIKWWWRAQHFILAFLSIVLSTWPESVSYNLFHKQLVCFYVYRSLVQYLQFRYQQGCLYRLKALGEMGDMDVTVEGFHTWMWRGLSFLLPFLYTGYSYELYNAWTLYQLSRYPDSPWQIPILASLFLILFSGNIVTTSMVIMEKLDNKAYLNNLHRSRKGI